MYVKLKANYDEFINVSPANNIHGIPVNYVRELVYFYQIADIKPIVLGEDKKQFQELL